MNATVDISIVIPVYYGEHTLDALQSAIEKAFRDRDSTYEVVYVHDCGPDNSLEVLRRLEKASNGVSVLELTRNYGQHNALIAGIEKAQGEYIVTMDEDLQHQPKDIFPMLEHLISQGLDVVYGTYDTLKHSWFRSFTSKIFKFIMRTAIPELDPDYTAFRIMRSSVAKEIVGMRNSYTFLDGYLSWVTKNTGSIVVEHKERLAGTSSYTLKKLIQHSLNIIFTFSGLPIRILSYSSIIIFILTLVYAVFLVYRKLVYNDLLLGFPTLIISLGIGIGLILMGLSIIGEYLYRVNLKTTKKPNYVLRFSSKHHKE